MGRGLFNYDGPLMSFLGRIADAAILNLTMYVVFIPVFAILFLSKVLTALPTTLFGIVVFFLIGSTVLMLGPAFTAAHYAALKIRRSEGHVWSNFWKSFRLNFKQGVWLGLVLGGFLLLNLFSFWIATHMNSSVGTIVSGALLAVILFTIVVIMWAFPIMSKFVNTVFGTIKSAFAFGFRYFFRSIYMILLWLIFPALILLGIQIAIPLALLFFFGMPIYLSSGAYNKIFEKLEEQFLESQKQSEEETEETELLETSEEQ